MRGKKFDSSNKFLCDHCIVFFEERGLGGISVYNDNNEEMSVREWLKAHPEKKVQIKEFEFVTNIENEIPTIPRSGKYGDGVLALFSTKWGEKARSLEEIQTALEVNHYGVVKNGRKRVPKQVLRGVLVWLVKSKKINRNRRGHNEIYMRK